MLHKVNGLSSKTEYIRKPAYAGRFYDGHPDTLKDSILKYMNKAKKFDVQGTVIGYISPHAGYVYSGPVAGYVYKNLVGKNYKTVFVLAPSHRVYFEGVSVIPSGKYRTPIGDVQIDEEVARDIIKYNENLLKYYPDAHANEHSLEVQVPFLQIALKEGWKIVPMVYGRNDFDSCVQVAEAIASLYEPDKQIIIASSDMSHHHPYDFAYNMDKKTLELISLMEIEKLADALNLGESELCGMGPVLTLMALTKALEGKSKILNYATSGDIEGTRSQVVGYSSVMFYTDEEIVRKKDYVLTEEPQKEKNDINFEVSKEQKLMLMDMTRKTLEQYISKRKIPHFNYEDPILNKELGLFVTLRKGKNKMLRGCIGHCFPVKKLRDSLLELTVASATQDPRFPSVKFEEIKDISIQISLLSPMRKIEDWREIQIPGHGVFVKKGFKSGVFLPQVADETGWDRDTFMGHLCQDKAGLNFKAWKDKDIELYVFNVIKFEENNL